MTTATRRDDLIVAHESFVRRVVLKTVKSLGLPNNLLEEYISAAYLGLVEAAHRYDETVSVPFDRFAYLRVRGAIIDYIREHSPLTGQAYRYAKALEGLESIEEETVSIVRQGKDPKKVLARIFGFAAQGAMSYRLCSYESQALLEQIPDEAGDAETSIAKRQLIERLKKLVQNLPEKERFIVEGYYFEGKSFVDLTRERPELSKSWISRLHSRALFKMHKLMMEEEDV